MIVGLGNPEEQYDGTRHNVGFSLLDKLANSNQVNWQNKFKFKAMIAELIIDNEKVILVKPSTYYNNSGEAIRSLSDFYRIDPQSILIVHDELMLPFGRVRTRIGGSDAGNNGIKSINQHIGPDTARLRIGIGQIDNQSKDSDFVTNRFNKSESTAVDKLWPKINQIIDDFISGKFFVTTHSD